MVELVRQSTFSMVNFEGTLATASDRGIRKEGPHLALEARALEALKSIGFRGITLANNHAMDYGEEGLRSTIRVSEDFGLHHVGAGLNLEQAIRPLKICLAEDVRLQILSLCEREFGVSTGNAAGTAWLCSPQAEYAVRQAKRESDLVIVCAHGGNELMPLPAPQRRQQLRHLIDAGADLVVGHHPHVPQAWEQYGGGYIFYSLGDFYFDSLDGNRSACRDWGFMVRVHLQKRRIEALEIVPYERVHDKIMPLGSRKDAEAHVSYLTQLSRIIAGAEFEGYWQHLAVDRLSAYVPFIRTRLTYPYISFRNRVRETVSIGRDLWHLWRFTEDPNARSSADYSRLPLAAPALGTLNVIRCESHRWVMESALAVLAGECKDLRSQKIKDELEGMRSFYGQVRY